MLIRLIIGDLSDMERVLLGLDLRQGSWGRRLSGRTVMSMTSRGMELPKHHTAIEGFDFIAAGGLPAGRLHTFRLRERQDRLRRPVPRGRDQKAPVSRGLRRLSEEAPEEIFADNTCGFAGDQAPEAEGRRAVLFVDASPGAGRELGESSLAVMIWGVARLHSNMLSARTVARRVGADFLGGAVAQPDDDVTIRERQPAF